MTHELDLRPMHIRQALAPGASTEPKFTLRDSPPNPDLVQWRRIGVALNEPDRPGPTAATPADTSSTAPSGKPTPTGPSGSGTLTLIDF